MLRDLRNYLESPYAVGEYLADQLMLPMALIGGGFRTRELSLHASTNLALLQEFLALDVDHQAVQIDSNAGVELGFRPHERVDKALEGDGGGSSRLR